MKFTTLLGTHKPCQQYCGFNCRTKTSSVYCSGIPVQDEGRVCPFPHQLRHLRGRHPHRDQELPWREVHQEGQDGPRRRCREQQGPEGNF